MYPQAVQIGCELEDLQKAVGGDIEATYPFNEPVALAMHDEGKLVGKELNRALRDDTAIFMTLSPVIFWLWDWARMIFVLCPRN